MADGNEGGTAEECLQGNRVEDVHRCHAKRDFQVGCVLDWSVTNFHPGDSFVLAQAFSPDCFQAKAAREGVFEIAGKPSGKFETAFLLRAEDLRFLMGYGYDAHNLTYVVDAPALCYEVVGCCCSVLSSYCNNDVAG